VCAVVLVRDIHIFPLEKEDDSDNNNSDVGEKGISPIYVKN
jgi:hypothetical protein